MQIRAYRTFLLGYGDNRDSYFLQLDQFSTECNVTRHYAGQKEWPRALYVRRARLYHSARLRYNSVDRRRTELEEQLVDDLLDWSLWHYATGMSPVTDQHSS
jgi:proteasome activator subunit 4